MKNYMKLTLSSMAFMVVTAFVLQTQLSASGKDADAKVTAAFVAAAVKVKAAVAEQQKEAAAKAVTDAPLAVARVTAAVAAIDAVTNKIASGLFSAGTAITNAGNLIKALTDLNAKLSASAATQLAAAVLPANMNLYYNALATLKIKLDTETRASSSVFHRLQPVLNGANLVSVQTQLKVLVANSTKLVASLAASKPAAADASLNALNTWKPVIQ